MLGALPELGPDGGFSVIVANGGQSKIDAFLERTTDVRIETAPDGSQGTRRRRHVAQRGAGELDCPAT